MMVISEFSNFVYRDVLPYQGLVVPFQMFMAEETGVPGKPLPKTSQ